MLGKGCKTGCLTVCVTGAGAGVDSACEQKKLEARKMLVNRADSPASSARGVGRRVCKCTTNYQSELLFARSINMFMPSSKSSFSIVKPRIEKKPTSSNIPTRFKVEFIGKTLSVLNIKLKMAKYNANNIKVLENEILRVI